MHVFPLRCSKENDVTAGEVVAHADMLHRN